MYPEFWICQWIFILNECFQYCSTSWFWSSKRREVIHLSSLFICIISWNLKTEIREVQTCFLNKNVSTLIGFMIKQIFVWSNSEFVDVVVYNQVSNVSNKRFRKSIQLHMALLHESLFHSIQMDKIESYDIMSKWNTTIPCLLNSNPETIIEIYIKKTLYMIIEWWVATKFVSLTI
jgi:hypothetical protein